MKDLENKRARVLEEKQETLRLRALLVKVDELYRGQMCTLRQELQHIRNSTSSFAAWTATESHTTLNHYKLQFQVIFDRYRAREEERDKELRSRLAVSHKRELDRLEDRFVAQIQALHEKHSKELSKLHAQLLVRTEQAVNHSQSAETPLSSIALPPSPQNASALLSRSLEMLSQSSLKLHSQQSHITSGLSAAPQIDTQPQKNNDPFLSVSASGSSSSRAAFASVLQGVLQGLKDQACVEEEAAQRVEALAKAHQEPSLAASAAARAMVGEAVDRFVLEVMRRKYADTQWGADVHLADADTNIASQ